MPRDLFCARPPSRCLAQLDTLCCSCYEQRPRRFCDGNLCSGCARAVVCSVCRVHSQRKCGSIYVAKRGGRCCRHKARASQIMTLTFVFLLGHGKSRESGQPQLLPQLFRQGVVLVIDLQYLWVNLNGVSRHSGSRCLPPTAISPPLSPPPPPPVQSSQAHPPASQTGSALRACHV